MSVSLITGIGEKVIRSRLTTPTGQSVCVCVCASCVFDFVCVCVIYICICLQKKCVFACKCVCDIKRGRGPCPGQKLILLQRGGNEEKKKNGRRLHKARRAGKGKGSKRKRAGGKTERRT